MKSHETDTTKVPQVLQDGNNCADYHAGIGVRECPSGEANRIRNIDSRARWFQERMVQAILMLPKKGRHPNEREHISEEDPHVRIPHITQRQARARILKHDVTRRGNMLECQRCGQFWESTASSLIFSQGVCPGPKIYGPPQRDRPWIIPADRGPIWWGKHKLHKSHKAAWYRGVFYCSGCGHFSLKGQSLRGLSEKCDINLGGRYCQITMNLF